MSRVVVSVTTLPTRYNKLMCTLDSIKTQSLKPDAIYLGLPKQASRLKQDYGPLPQDILSMVTVVPLDKDYGPICKILGGLYKETDPNTIIITIDDDVLYPNDHLEKIVAKCKLNSNAAVCASGLILSRFTIPFGAYWSICHNRLFSFPVPEEGRDVDIVYGFSGVGYRRGFFTDVDVLLSYTKHFNLFMNDDILLSAYLNSKGVKRKIFNCFEPIKYTSFGPEETDISYHRMTMVTRMTRAIKQTQDMGLLTASSSLSYDESLIVKVLMIIFFIILLILIGICFFWFAPKSKLSW